ncbi:hypothetical protein ITP53_52530, partial [Nonomuraea sp. K274]
RVVASMAGVAGYREAMAPELAKAWAAHGIAEEPRCGGDVPIAYAAGSPEPDGSLLLSGTGAAAARIVDFELDAVADALGWLLADTGSGFWIGREAAKAVVDALDRGLPVAALRHDSLGEALYSGTPAPVGAGGGIAGGLLTALVGEHFLGAERPATPRAAANRIVRLAQADHMRLAALSSLVSQAAAAGDPAAAGIVREAAGHLVATLGRVHVSGPVVLAGSVLTSDGPVRQAVIELLKGETVMTAHDAAGAAAWLAARDLLPEAGAKALHASFTKGP